MRLWLTRQFNGNYMITKNKVKIELVEGTSHFDAYVPAGDPVGRRDFCDIILVLIKHPRHLKRLESVEIELTGQLIAQ